MCSPDRRRNRRSVAFDSELRSGEVTAWMRRLAPRGWQRVEGEAALTLRRAAPDEEFYRRQSPGERVNRFPGMAAYGRKDELCLNLRRARRLLARRGGDVELVRHPETYLLPEEEAEWREAARSSRDALWLLKPRAASRGRGLTIVDGQAPLPEGAEHWLVQRYLQPHLIDGHKYGLRFYLLVTALDPLIVWVHQQGTCRVATRLYSESPTDRSDPLRHFLNTVIQQGDPEVHWSAESTDLPGYWRRLEEQGISATMLRDRIHRQLAACLLATREAALLGSRSVTPDLTRCWEFLGVDVQIDDALRPWILECNVAPPMENEDGEGAHGPGFYDHVKDALIRDQVAVLQATTDLGEEPLGAEHGARADWWRQRLAAETRAAGGWQLLWPAPTQPDDLGRAGVQPVSATSDPTRVLPLLRPLDRAVASGRPVKPRPLAVDPRLVPIDWRGGLVLWDPDAGRGYGLDELAAFLWLGAAEGLTADQLLVELRETYPQIDGWRLEHDLWSLLSAWTENGLLQDGFASSAEPSHEALPGLSCGRPAQGLSQSVGVSVGHGPGRPGLLYAEDVVVLIAPEVVERAGSLVGVQRVDIDTLPTVAASRLLVVLSASEGERRKEDGSATVVAEHLVPEILEPLEALGPIVGVAPLALPGVIDTLAAWGPLASTVEAARGLVFWLDGLDCATASWAHAGDLVEGLGDQRGTVER